MTEISSVQRGDATEARVITELVERGYAVSVPFGDNQRYDLIVDDDGDLSRVQVKTGTMKDGYIEFKLSSNRSHASGVEHKPYTEDEVDAFCVYCPEDSRVFWVPVSDTGTSAMRLRITAQQEQPGMNWAEDYEL